MRREPGGTRRDPESEGGSGQGAQRPIEPPLGRELATPGARERLSAVIFRETTTLGVRYRESEREVLDRDTVIVETAAGPIPIKVARRDGQVLNAAPEFDDCVRAAAASGRPVKEVQALAVRAFLDQTERA